ncbi:hypothetical protein P153DRAFT_118092 [Dothidotthia symphoricarpi CBS 119687]|uniref:Secreted protein n=1 Tax=Dothidotthia symphoricarpi CBS 119687 TaxID=1392245 RepID=A0A6A6A1E2_9PLEO|nr:uncharacterized protein P153DRAFT_118092 [Dothidotthia symphoricarpi CBS 119687]KAF2125015.1 hypothetical protein P153DRAFT_118092 [Dothidotthia symphoricarpi CBS 119687]
MMGLLACLFSALPAVMRDARCEVRCRRRYLRGVPGYDSFVYMGVDKSTRGGIWKIGREPHGRRKHDSCLASSRNGRIKSGPALGNTSSEVVVCSTPVMEVVVTARSVHVSVSVVDHISRWPTGAVCSRLRKRR